MYDLVLKNGLVIDGSGSLAFRADVAVSDGKIAHIAENISKGREILDVSGLTVTPGFIDSHSHSDDSVLTFPEQIEKVEQGITTAIGGQCGLTDAPRPAEEAVGEKSVFKTMGTFLDHARTMPLGSSLATFVGHCALRNAVMGSYDREPTPEELVKMGELLREAMMHGALGVSFGLIYPPSCFAGMDELVYLARTAAESGGMISSHIRNEGDRLIASCEEILHVVRASGVRAVLSHHKAMMKRNWGAVKTTLKMIDEANANGADVYMDVYPYTASHTKLSARFVPKEYHSGGVDALMRNLSDPVVREKITAANVRAFGAEDRLEWVLVTDCPETPEYAGLTLDKIAEKHGKDVYETVYDILLTNRDECHACYFLMCEEDIETVLRHPRSMICTDASVRGDLGVYHPRLRGSFPRALGRYVRERSIISLPEMIRKMTSLPASVYKLHGKGLLKEGYDADICVFDPDTVLDRAGYTDCHERAEGLRYVLVGGKIAAENAVFTGVKAGRVLG